MMKNNKKGLATGLIAIVLMMFFFGMMSLLSITMWNGFNDAIQDVDNSTISPIIKQQISDLGSKMLWGDKLFAFFFIAMLIAYLVSSVTIPTDSPEYLFIFMIMLILISVMCMIISNTWAYMVIQPNFIVAATELKFTNYVLSYYPVFAFLIGILGGGLFYGRKQGNFSSGSKGGGFNEVLE